ncbi:MAG: hypothetical protein AAGG07_04045 [Planctomycetota bacterium]
MPAVKHTKRTTHRPATVHRRGSFLVFVVGALSLLTVAVVAYVAVGSSDRRSSAAIETRAARADTATIAADYFAKVISDDLFEGVADPATIGGGIRREVTDYPYTPRDVIAKDDQTNAGTRFTPAGGGYDAWLAATEPLWLNPERVAPPAPADTYPFMLRQDWAHISNFSPTGRFVNLANLRDNFDAEPGAGGGAGGDPWRMSDRLALADPTTPFGQDLEIQDFMANQLTAFRTAVDTSPGPGSADDYRPAFFTRWQQFAFRPMVDPDTAGQLGPEITFADPESIFNQWADADGDGFADSRWIELTDFVDPDEVQTGTYNFDGDEFYDAIVPRAGGLRWFFAARAIDLSGLVNVNTASDFRRLAGDEARAFPAGSTPADIDLHRLLTMQDLQLDPTGTNGFFHYEAMEQPLDTGGNPDEALAGYYGDQLGEPVPTLAVRAGDFGMLPVRPTGDPANPAFSTQIQIGLRGRMPFVEPDATTVFPAFGATDYGDDGTGVAFAASQRGLTYTELAGRDAVWDGATLRTSRSFGTGSLLELLTYRGVNDPRSTSDLEAALSGRFGSGLTTTDAALWSPLRDNRPLTLERGLRDGDGEDGGFSELGVLDYYKGRPSARALAHAVTDIRQRLTTLSGARPLTSVPSADLAVATEITETEVRIDARSLLETLADYSAASTFGANADAWEALRALFLGYADALLPYSDATGAWDFAVDSQVAERTLSYGHRGAETAIAIAAHLTANMIDLYDDDGVAGNPEQKVTALTVLVDKENTATSVNPAAIDDWTARAESPDDLTGSADPEPGVLDLDVIAGAGRLRESTDGAVRSRAFNVYGLEAHPVISEAMMVTLYTDAPVGLSPVGGDQDWESGYTGVFPNDTEGDATINGTLDAANPDFIGRVLAVQVTNPYNQTIEMWDPEDGGSARYYLEFGGNFFALTNIPYDSANNWPEGNPTSSSYVGDQANTGELPPGESRVYLAIGEDPANPGARIKALVDAYNGSGDPTLVGTVDTTSNELWNDWLQTVFTVADTGGAWSNAPAIMPAIEPYGTGPGPSWTLAPGTAQGNERANPNPSLVNGTVAQANQQVLLWRRVINSAGSRGETLAQNHPYNDILVDRLRQESTGTTMADLDRKLPDGQNDVSMSDTAQDPTDTNYDPSFPNGNEGYSVILISSIRRPDGAGGDPGRGGIKSWMLENKIRGAAGGLGGGLGNTRDEDVFDVNSPIGQFASSSFAYQNVREFFDDNFGTMAAPQLDALFTIDSPPDEKTMNLLGFNLSGQSLADITLEHHLVNNRFEETVGAAQRNAMRTGDMLLPLAVGARFDPYSITIPGTFTAASQLAGWLDPGSPATRYDTLDQAWTTYGEAFAVALDYARDYDLDGGGAVADPTDAGDVAFLNGLTHPLDAIGTPAETNTRVNATLNRDIAVLDRGQLMLDAFVPFRDVAANGNLDNNEQLAGDGLPLALGILDRFTVFDDGYGDLTRAMPGLININTASVDVLRTLPMLSPLHPESPGGLLTGQWWWTADTQHDFNSDIAASIASYRDKIALTTRTVFDGSGAPVAGSLLLAGFTEGGATDAPDELGTGAVNEGRRIASQVPGIRETPGFASIGELMAVRSRPNINIVTTTDGLHDIDRLAFDGTDLSNGNGIVSVVYEDPNVTNVLDTFESISDDYDERLIIANALSNIVTVRSDYFAVWFVVHGYGPGDVEGLADDQPMTPTVQRRYLLVLDRSNVFRQGQQPRVVLFQELPL